MIAPIGFFIDNHSYVSISPFAQGIMVANCVWLLFHLMHRAEHVCMPKGKMWFDRGDGEREYFASGPLTKIFKNWR